MSDSESDFDPAEEFFYIFENENPNENLKKLKFLAKSIDFTEYQDKIDDELAGAAEANDIDLIKFLVKIGAKDDDNRALSLACEQAHPETVKFLLKNNISTIDDEIRDVFFDTSMREENLPVYANFDAGDVRKVDRILKTWDLENNILPQFDKRANEREIAYEIEKTYNIPHNLVLEYL